MPACPIETSTLALTRRLVHKWLGISMLELTGSSMASKFSHKEVQYSKGETIKQCAKERPITKYKKLFTAESSLYLSG
jgi:hypothetical protein